MKSTTRVRKRRPPANALCRVEVSPSAAPLLRHVGFLAAERGFGVYAVGGCVRDWLLGIDRTPDLDVAVEGDGVAFARAAADRLRASLVCHEQFGTATLHLSGSGARSPHRLDVASCRREEYAKPAAYPRVTPGTLRDDLFRRDFTINAMAVQLGAVSFGLLVDPYGGAGDLAKRQLRVLHPRSFLDDPSRILRGVRFAERFGLSWERRTKTAARRAIAQGALGWLNAGRFARELDRMTEEPEPVACLEHLARLLAP